MAANRERPPTIGQRRRLEEETQVSASSLGFTWDDANGWIERIAGGEAAVIREELIKRGGTKLGELPDPDEVGVSESVGRLKLRLPRSFDRSLLPAGPLVVEVVRGGLLITTRPPGA